MTMVARPTSFEHIMCEREVSMARLQAHVRVQCTHRHAMYTEVDRRHMVLHGKMHT